MLLPSYTLLELAFKVGNTMASNPILINTEKPRCHFRILRGMVFIREEISRFQKVSEQSLVNFV
jgi:hypothetical protein